MGSKLITKQALENRDYAGITDLTRQAFDIFNSVRGAKVAG
jgi:2-keto-3-deoxy-6-phosphogluconate aldolase